MTGTATASMADTRANSVVDGEKADAASTTKTHSARSVSPARDEPAPPAASSAPPENSRTLCLLAVFAGWLLFFMAWGPTLAYGLFQDFYQSAYLATYSASAIAWIGAINAFFLVVVGVFAGPLFDRGYMRPLMAVGCFLSVFGMMMLSLAREYYQIFLAQGVCVGIGSGLVYVPALAMVGRLFVARRSLAVGIVTTGASIGGVIMPIVFLRLQAAIGFPWATRVLGFVQLVCAAVALPILWQLSLPPGGQARQLIHWHAFRSLAFSAYFVSGFLVFMAYLVPLVYIAPYAVQVLQTAPATAYYQLAVSNGVSALGRLTAAVVAPRLGGPNVLVFSLLSSSLLTFAWIGVASAAGFWVWCAVWGFCSGIIIAVNPVVVAHPAISHSPAVLGTRLGMQWFSTAFGLLVGIPIAGALLQSAPDARGAYTHLQIFGGCIMLGGAAFFMVPYWSIRRHNVAAAREKPDAS